MTRLAYVPNRIIDHNGIADGATVHVYLSGSTTPVLLYSNSAMTTPMSNPFSVAAGASFPDVFYDSSVNIKLTIVSALDGSIEEHDPYNPLSVSVTSPVVSVKTYGAVGDGVADDYPAIAAAIAALEAQALNATGGGFYKGSQALYAPAGTYKCSQAIDIKHTLKLYGDGSGRLGPGAGGCTRFKFPAACDGFRIQATNTSGNTTVDGSTHDGSGGVVLEDFCIEGGYAGTESDHHGLVVRNAITAVNLYIKTFPGEGVKAWAGNITGFGNVAGNVSTMLLIGVKTEGNRGGIDIRGSEANVVTTINCEGYQNRQFGYLDDNGAGSNTVIGMHCASNGLISNIGVYTQCSNSGNVYAAKWGGDPTVAPSGTTADTANWLYIQAGAPIANLIPAWANTPGLFRAGGDYITINSASVFLLNCYSEGGGFSQLTNNTIAEHGTIGKQYSRGGWRWIAQSDGLALKTGPTGGNLIIENDTEMGLFAQDSAGIAYGYLDFVKGGGNYLNSHTGTNFRIDGATVSSIDASGNYSVGANKVVGARGSAISRLTRTATAGSLPTADGSITIANGATPTVQELLEYCTELEAKLEALTASLRAATGHGLIA